MYKSAFTKALESVKQQMNCPLHDSDDLILIRDLAVSAQTDEEKILAIDKIIELIDREG